MRLALRPQVLEVDRAVRGRLDHDDLHAGHHRRGGVGAVRRRRDQADVARLATVGPVVAADRQQPGQLALRAGVRLDRDPVVARHLGQPSLEVADELLVAQRVLGRRERVQVGEPGQRHRLHLGGGVELHGARAERDHAAVERVVARAEPPQVAQHLRLGAVGREDLVGQVRRLAPQGIRQRVAGGGVERVEVRGHAEGLEHARGDGLRRGLRRREPTRSASTSRRCSAERRGRRRRRARPRPAPARSGCRRTRRARPRARPRAGRRR